MGFTGNSGMYKMLKGDMTSLHALHAGVSRGSNGDAGMSFVDGSLVLEVVTTDPLSILDAAPVTVMAPVNLSAIACFGNRVCLRKLSTDYDKRNREICIQANFHFKILNNLTRTVFP